jgi:hypothetical protein
MSLYESPLKFGVIIFAMAVFVSFIFFGSILFGLEMGLLGGFAAFILKFVYNKLTGINKDDYSKMTTEIKDTDNPSKIDKLAAEKGSF